MHVNARKIALSGVLAAFAVVLIVLGSIFETSTLFLLAAAAFCVGIVVREWGIAYGAAFLTAGVYGFGECNDTSLHCAWCDRFSAEDVLCDICGNGNLSSACGGRMGSACESRTHSEEKDNFVGVEISRI